MLLMLVLIGIVIILCVLLNNASYRIGMPMLLLFILLGMLFGDAGIIPVTLDLQARQEVGDMCTIALIFIMFYGGFGTSWKSAKPIAVEAGLMATLGVVVTAGLTGVFCRVVLRWEWLEALLMGSVVASTDAASVFSILRSRKMGLKNNAGSMLEVESGSNDPMSYMLTIILISLMQGEASVGHSIWLFFAQMGFGVIFGLVISTCAIIAMKRINFATAGFNSLFLMAIALLSYALPALCDGNGYLSAYIVGIVLGNTSFADKKEMVHFFDGITGLMQVLIFFMLGLLATPATLQMSILPALAIFGIITFIARPLSVEAILLPFRKYKLKHRVFTSFCGLRGAASIVFAILATTSDIVLENDIFNIVFCIVLISIALQGSLLPVVAKKLDMTSPDEDIMKTFTDFSDDVNLVFSELLIKEEDKWEGKTLRELSLPKELLFCMHTKPDGTTLIPSGNTLLEAGDKIILCAKQLVGNKQINIVKHTMSENSRWDGQMIKDLPNHDGQIIMIQREGKTIIPHGSTVMRSRDILYINKIK